MCLGRFILFALNTVVLCVGVGLVTVASMVIDRSSRYGELMMDGILTLPIWTIIVGIIISLIGFFGCFGAMRQNKCMLYMYGTIVLLLFAAQMTLGIMVLVNIDAVKGTIKTVMETGFGKYFGEDEAWSKSIDLMQEDLECCGVDNYKFWFNQTGKHEVTQGCCRPDTETPACFTTLPESEDDLSKQIFTRGCYDTFLDWMDDLSIGLGVIAIILALVQLLCVFFACSIAREAGSTKHY